MRLVSRLVLFLAATTVLLPSTALAADGILSLRMSDDQRLLVYIDGEEVGKTPLELPLAPGRYDFEVKVAEYSSKSVRGTGVVRSGQTTAMVGNWEARTFSEDLAATRGTIEVTLSLASANSTALPEDLGAELWPQLTTAARCGDEDISASDIEVTEIEGQALARLITVKHAPPGNCLLDMSLFGSKAASTHLVKVQQMSSADVRLELAWAMVQVARLEGKDRAKLIRQDDEGEEQSTALSTKPLLVRSGPGRVVLQHSSTSLEVADLTDLAGSVSIDPYGTLVFADEVQVDGLQLTLNGNKRTFTSQLVLPVGEWTIGLSAPGAHPTERTISIGSGKESAWSGSLSSVAPAQVSVSVAGPTTWQLRVNGKKSEASDPLELAPGKYKVEVSAKGWASQSKELEVSEAQQAELSFELAAHPVSVRFTGLVSGSKITLTSAGGEATEASASGEYQVDLPVGRYRWTVEANDRSAAQGSFELKPGQAADDIKVELPWTELALVQRSTRARTAVLAGIAGALAGTGIAFIVDGQDLYRFAAEQHDEYLVLTDPDDILWAKNLRDDSITLGQTYEGVGWALVGAAAGAGAAAAVSAIIGNKKAQALSASLLPRPHGATFALIGRW